MHEFTIIRNLLDIILEIAAEERLSRVTSVTLRIGDLLHIVPETLVFAFDSVVKETVCEGARLEIEHVPVTLSCRECGTSFVVENNDFTCPGCASGDCEMTGGKELTIVKLDGDE
jgi:hydrogenase nickel incorporation protein HypA/HybF